MTNVSSHPLTAANAATNALRDIKPPVVIPSGWAWLWWTLAALTAVAVAIWAWFWWQKRRAEIPTVAVIPPHVRAKARLREALALLHQPREFCTMVSDTVRQYLEERFAFHAPERTTEEFLYELQATDLLTRDQKESLGEFLQQCDLVKFARYEPREPELHALHDAALRLVEETEPITTVPDIGQHASPSGTPASAPDTPQTVVK